MMTEVMMLNSALSMFQIIIILNQINSA